MFGLGIGFFLFKTVIQLNFDFILILVGVYWKGYESGSLGRGLGHLSLTLPESLSPCCGGKSPTCCLEMPCMCEQCLGVEPPGEMVNCNW